MKKKSKIILGVCIVAAALIGVRMEYLVQSYKDCFHQLPDHTAGKHLESQRQFIHQTQRSVS